MCDENDSCDEESCIDVEVTAGKELVMLEIIDESESCGSNIEFENERSISEIDGLKFGTTLSVFFSNFLSGGASKSAGKDGIVLSVEGRVDVASA